MTSDDEARSAVSRDVDEELRERAEQLRLALEAGRMGSWEWEIASGEVRWSPTLEAIHGLAPGTFAGTFAAYQEDIHPDDRARVLEAIRGTVERGEEHHLEYRIVWPDGSIHWVEARGSVFRAPSGEPVRVLGICTDVTERTLAEDRLRESERRYRAVVESQSEMVCRFRPDGTILFSNAAYARAHGSTPEALAGTSFWEFVSEEDRAAVRAMLDRLSPESPEIRIENRLQTVDGTRWTLWTNRALSFDAAGRVTEAQATGIDITDRKRAEEALREADRRKDEFLATLAHELRNPLAPLRSGLSVLKLAHGEPETFERTRAMMERQLVHMVRLIDDLLDLSRISRGRITLRRERMPLDGAIRAAIEASRPAIDGAGHTFRLDLPAEPLVVDGDPVRLAQVFANLLGNAAKFTDPGGRIDLVVEREGTEALVRVRDDGIGIPREHLSGLFDAFARGNPSRETSRVGLGIGLSLVKGLVALHEGSVEARSDGPGSGSEFIVRLPLVVSGPPPAATVAEPAAATGGRRILVVDDNVDAATSLASLLELSGNVTATAFDGFEAVEVAERFRPDAILLDVGLPKLDGHETARRIREQPWGRNVLIVAVTGWGQEADQRRSREAGFDHHLVKPVDPEVLARLLGTDLRPPSRG